MTFRDTENTFKKQYDKLLISPADLHENLILAVGFALGGNLPSMAAAITLAIQRLFPDEGLPIILENILNEENRNQQKL